MQSESRLGVPTFVWVGRQGASSFAASRPTLGNSERSEVAAARGVLSEYAALYGLSMVDVGKAVVSMVHNTGKGPIVVKFSQRVGDIEIFREEVNVLMTRQLEPVAVSGYITSIATPAAQGGSLAFSLGAPSVAIAAVREVTTANVASSQLIPAGSHDGYEYYTLPASSGAVLDEPVRMKQVYFHLPEGLVAAYYLEVIAEVPADGLSFNGPKTSTEGYGYVISAVDGQVLFRKNLTADAQGTQSPSNTTVNPGGFVYRVWADPVSGVPYDTPAGNLAHPKVAAVPDGFQSAFVATNDVTLQNITFSQNDPWLTPGATETVGNNVDAFLNLFSPDGFGNPTTTNPTDPPTADFRAQITAAGQFLHTHTPDTNTSLAEGRQGSIQQLFYNNNFLHDWYYDSGFDEASGNAQANNFGRGGLANDSIKAQAQDFSGFSNANMLTPADGGRPRMRMYVFPNLANMLDIQAPPAIVGKINIGISMSGPGLFDITNDIVVATFSNSPSACTVTNAAALNGKIALFDFDNTDGTGCSFSTRIARLTTTTGASSIIMAYTSANANVVANITGFVTANTKPVATISWNNSLLIKGQLSMALPVTARLYRQSDRDGTIDNQIVFHEWCHYLSNRLISNGSGLVNQAGGGMGEGWSDFNAMILTARADDTLVPSNSNWNGAYALATYATSGVPFNGAANQGYYFGIRRYPYSTDMNINPLTFHHIQNNIPLPVGPPLGFGASGSNNAEVHNTGEVWTTMLWECYAALLRDTIGPTPRLTFAQAQDRMKSYLVASLKMTPIAPTFLDARDAMLSVAYANDLIDFTEFSAGFAKRGAGIGAIAPDRYNTTNTPVTESFETGPELSYRSATLDDALASCDHDGVLDSGETGRLTIALNNIGSVPLSATTATITSLTSGFSLPNGSTINFPPSDPGAVTLGSVDVRMDPGVSGIQQANFQVDYSDIQVAHTSVASVRANTNSIPASSATDTVEPVTTPWTATSNPTFGPISVWTRKEVGALQHVWHVGDPNHGMDEMLTSPVFTVDGSGSFNLQFDHSWAFEFDASGNYDGGVVEISVNGGAFTDLGAAAYNGLILGYAGTVNPLGGRQGFVKTGTNVHSSLTQAVAPGSTVQVRFRAGSDSSGDSTGWDVDTIAFTGVVETPFPTLVADAGCTLPTSTALATSANPSPKGASLTLTATVTSASPVTSGNVTFYDGASIINTASVNSSGVATTSTSTLTVGSHSLTALFSGVSGFAPSTSPVLTENITKAATTLGLMSSQNPSTLGQSVTFTATVSSTSGAPTGSVSFYDGPTLIGNATLTGGVGVAQFTTSSLTGGVHTILASYAGNVNFGSSSNSISQDVQTGSLFNIAAPAYWTLENAGVVTITVTRTGGNTSGAANVHFGTSDGTAMDGVRYTATSQPVFFAAGETSKTVDVPLINNSTIEGKQTFNVALTLPSAGALGATTTAVVSVLDDDTVNSDFSNSSDGKRDLLWRNPITGDTRTWLMNGITPTSSVLLPSLGTSFTLAGVGDFNADGHADLLWRNNTDFSMTVWYMNGTSLLSTAPITAPADGNWVLSAVGDMNGDGYPDLIWRNSSTFQATIWLMRDTTILSGVSLTPTIPDANWQIVGVGDFNRDKKLDIVWHNSGGNTAVWLMSGNGTTFGSATNLPTVGTPWVLVGVGDMNGDGDADLIWQTTTTRQIAIWQMNQTSFGSAALMPTTVDSSTANDPNWKIVSPR